MSHVAKSMSFKEVLKKLALRKHTLSTQKFTNRHLLNPASVKSVS